MWVVDVFVLCVLCDMDPVDTGNAPRGGKRGREEEKDDDEGDRPHAKHRLDDAPEDVLALDEDNPALFNLLLHAAHQPPTVAKLPASWILDNSHNYVFRNDMLGKDAIRLAELSKPAFKKMAQISPGMAALDRRVTLEYVSADDPIGYSARMAFENKLPWNKLHVPVQYFFGNRFQEAMDVVVEACVVHNLKYNDIEFEFWCRAYERFLPVQFTRVTLLHTLTVPNGEGMEMIPIREADWYQYYRNCERALIPDQVRYLDISKAKSWFIRLLTREFFPPELKILKAGSVDLSIWHQASPHNHPYSPRDALPHLDELWMDVDSDDHGFGHLPSELPDTLKLLHLTPDIGVQSMQLHYMPPELQKLAIVPDPESDWLVTLKVFDPFPATLTHVDAKDCKLLCYPGRGDYAPFAAFTAGVLVSDTSSLTA